MGRCPRIVAGSVVIAALAACAPDAAAPSNAVRDPIEVAFEHTAPEVQKFLQDLIDRSRQRPANGERRGELAMAYEVNGFPEAAFATYRQAEALAPMDARWPYLQALMHAERGDHRLALDAVDRSLAIDDGYAAAWLWRGTWSLELGLDVEAAEAFDQARSLGNEGPATLGQALVSIHAGDPGKAIELLEPLAADVQHPNVYQLLGRAYREAGRAEDARDTLAKAGAAEELRWEDPRQASKQFFEGSFDARAALAYGYLQAGEPAPALEILRALVELRPDDRVVLHDLSFAYSELGEEEEAFRVLRRALLRHPNDFVFHYRIAEHYGYRGELDTALQHVDQAIDLNPAAAAAYVRKGLLLIEQRRYVAALDAFEAALRYEADDPQIFLHAGQMAATLKRWPHAIQRFEQSVALEPSFTLGHINLAGGYAFTGRFEEARASLVRAEQLGTHAEQVRNAFRLLAAQEADAQ